MTPRLQARRWAWTAACRAGEGGTAADTRSRSSADSRLELDCAGDCACGSSCSDSLRGTRRGTVSRGGEMHGKKKIVIIGDEEGIVKEQSRNVDWQDVSG